MQVLNQYKKSNAELNDPKTIQPLIRFGMALCSSFKARPIKLDDFKSFVGRLNVTEFPKLDELGFDGVDAGGLAESWRQLDLPFGT